MWDPIKLQLCVGFKVTARNTLIIVPLLWQFATSLETISTMLGDINPYKSSLPRRKRYEYSENFIIVILKS